LEIIISIKIASLLTVTNGAKSKYYRNLVILFLKFSKNSQSVNELVQPSKVYHTLIFQNLLLKDKVFFALLVRSNGNVTFYSVVFKLQLCPSVIPKPP